MAVTACSYWWSPTWDSVRSHPAPGGVGSEVAVVVRCMAGRQARADLLDLGAGGRGGAGAARRLVQFPALKAGTQWARQLRPLTASMPLVVDSACAVAVPGRRGQTSRRPGDPITDLAGALFQAARWPVMRGRRRQPDPTAAIRRQVLPNCAET